MGKKQEIHPASSGHIFRNNKFNLLPVIMEAKIEEKRGIIRKNSHGLEIYVNGLTSELPVR